MISSYSSNGASCINVEDVTGLSFLGEIAIKETDNPVLSIVTSKKNFKAFIEGVKAGEFDHFVEGVE